MVALASAIGTSSLKTCWYPPLLATFVSHAYVLIIGVGDLSAVLREACVLMLLRSLVLNMCCVIGEPSHPSAKAV